MSIKKLFKNHKKLTIELGEEIEPTVCDCCNDSSFTLLGYIYEKGDAHSVYYVGWNLSHSKDMLTVALGIGDWSDDADAESDREAFYMHCYFKKEEYSFEFIDPDESPWGESDFLGKKNNADKARVHPEKDVILRDIDFIFSADERIIKHLEKAS